jgi:hypothetical protein
LLEKGRNDAALLLEKGKQQVFDVHPLMASAHRMGRSRLQGFLKLNGHSVHIHTDPVLFGNFRLVPT